jgi:hypothetical protein
MRIRWTFPSLPYIAVYSVKRQVIEILRLYHAAQDWLSVAVIELMRNTWGENACEDVRVC